MFKIQTSNNAVLDYQMKKEIAGIDARTILKTKIRVAEHKINTKDNVEKRYIDVADARKDLVLSKKNYDRTCPETLTPFAQNAMWKRAKKLKDEFMIGMLSKDELHPIKGIEVNGSISNIVDWEKINTTRSVERNSAWYNRNALKISEFKNIMRHLCPDNPTASDIERYRPKGGFG